MSKFVRVILIVIGTISLGLGIIGIVLPVLPTTPFLLLAAACYFRSSERLYQWIINHKRFGPYIRNYREKREIPFKTKVVALVMLWTTITISAVFFIDSNLVRAILAIVVVAVTWHIASLKTPSDLEAEAGANAGNGNEANL